MRTTDVLIVGAGPTGLTLACELLHQGISFRIIEQNAGPTELSKALGVQARTLELLGRFGLSGEMVGGGHPAKGLNLTVRGTTYQVVDLGRIGEGLSPFPFVLILEQSKTERILCDYVRANGGDIEWKTRLVSFSQTEEHVDVALERADGRREQLRCRYLVGADGAGSLVRHGLGIPLEGGTYERTFYLADVAMEGEFDHERLHLVLRPGRFLAAFPMRGGARFRILGYVPEHLAETDLTFEHVREIVETDSEVLMRLSACRWVSKFRLHHRMVSRFSAGRVFLCGDAAHIHSPAGGQGMNTGMQDAINLGWKLARVVRGDSSPRLLESYHAERAPFARWLLRFTDRGFLLMTGRGLLRDLARRWVLPLLLPRLAALAPLRRRIFRVVSQIWIHYRKSSLSRDELPKRRGTVRAGDRLPPLRVRPKGAELRAIYELCAHPGWTAFVFSDGPDGQALALPRDECRVVLLPDDPENRAAAEALGVAGRGVIVVRPDGYVGYRGPLEPGRVADYFRALGV